MVFKKYFLFIAFFAVLFSATAVFATLPRATFLEKGDITVRDPEVSQLFYDELKTPARYYFIEQNESFNLDILLLAPAHENMAGRYSANIFSIKDGVEEKLWFLDGSALEWQLSFQSFDREYYLEGPRFSSQMEGGKYKIEVLPSNYQPSEEETIEFNGGKYVLAVGKKEQYTVGSFLNVYWQLPFIKITYLKTSPLQVFLTPFGILAIGVIGVLLVIFALIYFFIGTIKESLRHHRAKTLLLTSTGMDMKEEIGKLLQKPAYDITVAFITTAAKPLQDLDFLKKDWNIMRNEMGFNIEEVDIEGKTEAEVMNLLRLKDIIFVEGGNSFYLLKAMRACNFEKIIRKLLQDGKVYIGVSAGSIVAGRSIKHSLWKNPKNNIVELKNLKGLNLVPFDIFVHFQPEHADLIMKKAPYKWQRRKIKAITDEQAILVQGKDIMLIGKGEAAVF